jgi:predicted metal-dependent phosphoesterase TrpH
MGVSGKIDLHMHTTVSDGTDAPGEIVARVREAGIGLFSVTDHDAVKAGRIIPPLLTEGDPAFLTGAEFSCRDEEGKYHILGYGYDPDAEPIRELVEKGHRLRIGKVAARLNFLKREFGFSFPQEELEALFALDNPGKPHIANMMVRHGYARSKEQAIKEFINRIRFRNEYVRPEDAIRGILGGGGIPVLAHPSYGDGDQLILGEKMDERLRHLMEFGLQGVEAFYSGFTPRLCREMLSFAERYELYVTAGSDYHGTNKMVLLGDTGLDDPDEWPEGLRRFLRDAPKQGKYEI